MGVTFNLGSIRSVYGEARTALAEVKCYCVYEFVRLSLTRILYFTWFDSRGSLSIKPISFRILSNTPISTREKYLLATQADPNRTVLSGDSMNRIKPFVLVVDDMEDMADTLVDLLVLWGYDAQACYCGASALVILRNLAPELVILDIAMGPMNGFTLTSKLRKVSGCEAIPIVAMSGYTNQEYQLRARTLGIAHYLLKPLDLPVLQNVVSRCIVKPSPVRVVKATTRHRSENLSGAMVTSNTHLPATLADHFEEGVAVGNHLTRDVRDAKSRDFTFDCGRIGENSRTISNFESSQYS
jgi:two-component system, OmpR family, response regulator